MLKLGSYICECHHMWYTETCLDQPFHFRLWSIKFCITGAHLLTYKSVVKLSFQEHVHSCHFLGEAINTWLSYNPTIVILGAHVLLRNCIAGYALGWVSWSNHLTRTIHISGVVETDQRFNLLPYRFNFNFMCRYNLENLILPSVILRNYWII